MSDPLSAQALSATALTATPLTGRELGTPSGSLPPPPENPLLYSMREIEVGRMINNRPIGNVYYWDGEQYALESDNTKVVFIGKKQSTETSFLSGYHVPIFRRPFLQGLNPGVGDILYHQNISGDTRLVHLVTVGGSTPNPWQFTHSEIYGEDAVDASGNVWRSGVPYAIEYGAYTEPSTTMLTARPADVDIADPDWTSNVNITRISGGNASVIEGQFSIEYDNRGGSNALIRPNAQYNFVTGTRVTWLSIVQHISGDPIMRFQVATSSPEAYFLVNFNTGEVAVTDSLGASPEYRIRWLGNKTCAIWMSVTPTLTRNSYFYLYPANLTANLMTFRVHYNGWANVGYAYQPIPSAGTRNQDAVIDLNIGTRQAFWIDGGLDTEFQSLALVDNSQNAAQWAPLNARTGYYSLHSVGSSDFRNQTDTGKFTSISTPVATMYHSDVTLLGANVTHNLSRIGSLDQQSSIATYIQGTDTFVNVPDSGMLWNIKGGSTPRVAPAVLRGLAIWNKTGQYDFANDLGFNIHIGQPLP